MASPARAQKRRTSRSRSKNKTDNNGSKVVDQSVAGKPPPSSEEEGAVAANGVFVQVMRGESGNLEFQVQPVGDVKITEVQTLLEVAIKQVRTQLGLDQS